ncbi:MAG: hypothetical protein Q8861_02090 [Bacteroidota bacterium]|nr:hypothetical protein [Bacteroidota bacterium]
MKKQIFYFKDEDSDGPSFSLDDILDEAKEEGLKTILVYEAIPDKFEKDFIWCMEIGEATERKGCTKKLCSEYVSKNGKNGICKQRGNLYTWGTPHLFDVETGKELPLPEDYDAN